MIGSVAVPVSGFRVGGAFFRELQLREITGEDQVYLVEEAGALPPAHWTTELLRRCAFKSGDGEPLTGDVVRSLTVGDREALILQLRRLTWGDRMQCVLSCPSPDCGEKLDLQLSVTDLLVPARDGQPERYEASVTGDDTSWLVRFRLPTGSDQEAVAGLARGDLSAAVETLLLRSIDSAVSREGADAGGLPEAVRQQLPGLMSELDPQAEIKLTVTCQVCGGTFEVLFDAAGYFFQELKAGMRLLFHEVHLLAYHYHWSLREILGMSVRSRRRFLQLLEEELSAGASA
jgi:hypothetical protein